MQMRLAKRLARMASVVVVVLLGLTSSMSKGMLEILGCKIPGHNCTP